MQRTNRAARIIKNTRAAVMPVVSDRDADGGLTDVAIFSLAGLAVSFFALSDKAFAGMALALMQ
ncbi:MAG TPA: hypothetical protein VET89_08125 [Stellaceae bacterium]|jgi:hypothetical protein|nr:hypothetical protein [Stellaceae bacterium]